MSSSARSWVASRSSSSVTWPKPARSCADAGVPSWSTHATLKRVVPPEKMAPNRTTKITGKAIDQNIASRLRVKLLMLAMVIGPRPRRMVIAF
jgi:hypothetical protein